MPRRPVPSARIPLTVPPRRVPLAGMADAYSLVHRLGREIVRGAYPENTLLPAEPAMLARYGVSRTALREAYGKLAAKGLIAARPKVGTGVRPKLDWNMLDPEVLSWHLDTMPAAEIATHLYALRRMIEPGAAEMAACRHTEADLARIEAAFRAMQASALNDADLISADLRFHLGILRATQNPFITAFSALIHAALVSSFELSWRGAEEVKAQRLDQHGAVAQAIRTGNAALARRRMEGLLDDSIEDVREALAIQAAGVPVGVS